MRSNVFDSLLLVGPENDKGGIGSVLKLYEQYLPGSTFIGTYPSSSEESKYKFFIKSVYKIIKLISVDSKIKIIHLHSASKGSFIRKSVVCMIGKLFNKKIIMHIHGGGFKEYYNSGLNKYYIRYICKISDKIICLSEEWNNFFKTFVDKQKIIVLGNPVVDYKQEQIIDNTIKNDIKMLFLGNINEEKGIFQLIEFLNKNKYFKINQIKLVIGGFGDSEKLNRLMHKNHNYHYAGWVNNKEKIKFLIESDVFILPSLKEGLPMSILEAMSAGKAIIATNVGGIPSIVKEKYNGWLLNVDQLEKLDQIFDEIMDNKDILKRYGQNSYIDSEKFHAKNIIKKIENIYNEI
jgi:glycosyltransferase involved in cell wall biosynthesis